MNDQIKIKRALISVFDKSGLEPIIKNLHRLGVEIVSTGGTKDFIEAMGISAVAAESITDYPSILGGRVKTLHPKIFGGILARRENPSDSSETETYEIPLIDLVIVDLYPFEQTLKSTNEESAIIEKIDIGGISLIRAAAKNHKDVLIVSCTGLYAELNTILEEKEGISSISDRKRFAAKAFEVSSHYDSLIFSYFNREQKFDVVKISESRSNPLRYGENPHQKGQFFGNLEEVFEKLNGKEVSYNNLLDIDAAVHLLSEFKETAFAILKHNNACGFALNKNVKDAYLNALAGDPISAFGGVLICNREIEAEAASEINKLFFEIILAPSFSDEALAILKSKTNRIILKLKTFEFPKMQYRSLLNGILAQEKDLSASEPEHLKVVTEHGPDARETDDLVIANKLVKHTKSNAIVLVKNKQLAGIGTGHTSRVDALKHAISKAAEAGLSLDNAVMASDAFFPFPDCVEIALNAGIQSVVQPGGSVKDKDSIEFCNKNNMKMVFTGVRHFKH